MAKLGQAGAEFGSPAVFNRQYKPHHHDVPTTDITFYVASYASTIIGWIVLCATAFALRGWTPAVWWHYLVVAGVVLMSMIAGSVIAIKSESWKASAAAYLGLIAAPLGVLFGPFVLNVGVDNMVYGMLGTAAWTVLLSLIGLAIPADMERAGFGKLILVLMGLYLFASIVLFKASAINATVGLWVAIVGIVIFSMGLVYNVNRSKFVPKNLDNAVDIGMQNFLETVNIALRLAQVIRYLRA